MSDYVLESGPQFITERRANVMVRWEYEKKILFFFHHNGYADQDINQFWTSIPPQTPILNPKMEFLSTVEQRIKDLKHTGILK